jgi:NAD dependent epimerase/dehydratase family enzyme
VHRPALFPVPAFGPGVLLGRELAQNLLFTSADVRPAVLRDAGFAFAHADIDTALAAVLGKESA